MKALTVGDLLEQLAKYPHDTPVFATWEELVIPLCFEAKSRAIKRRAGLVTGVVIDANDYDFQYPYNEIANGAA